MRAPQLARHATLCAACSMRRFTPLGYVMPAFMIRDVHARYVDASKRVAGECIRCRRFFHPVPERAAARPEVPTAEYTRYAHAGARHRYAGRQMSPDNAAHATDFRCVMIRLTPLLLNCCCRPRLFYFFNISFRPPAFWGALRAGCVSLVRCHDHAHVLPLKGVAR